MVKKFLKIVLTSELVLTLFSGSVFAVTGKVTGNNVRIREKATSKSPEVSVATKGEKVDVIGEEGDWYQVKFEKVTGYISKDYVDTDYTSESTMSTQTSTDTTNESEKVSAANENQAETETTELENADSVQNSETTESENVNSVPNPETTSEETEANKNETKNYEENQEITFEHDVNLRYLPNFSSRVHATATSGSTYVVKSSLNNWVKVSNDMNSGWVLKNDITSSDSSTQNNNETSSDTTTETSNNTDVSSTTKGKVNVDSARIRKSPNGEVLDSLSKGTEVTILNEENDWYKISTDKYNSCYIAKRLITEL